jgi:hypothetical protein
MFPVTITVALERLQALATVLVNDADASRAESCEKATE